MGLWSVAPLLILVSGTAGGKIINIIFKLSKDYLNQKGIDVFYLGKIQFKKFY
jgi:hypothetical protein